MKISRTAVIVVTVAALGTTTLATSAVADPRPDDYSSSAAGQNGQNGQNGQDGQDGQDFSSGQGSDEGTDGTDQGGGPEVGSGTADPQRKYRVKPGVVFNHPGRGDKVAYRILDKIKSAISHTKKGAQIRVMSWNYASSGITQKLIAAHRRGVSVQFIMARSLAGGSGSFRQLTAALKKGNAGRPPALKSFTRTCSHSCRGGGGAMHSKFMTISKTGASRDVVMQGSSNFTQTAAANQWNDWFTTVGNQKVYNTFFKEFELAKKDRKSALRDSNAGDITSWFSPRKAQPDLVRKMLRKVKCRGARGGTGDHGRTVIRIASAVWQDDRGQAIGREVKALQRQGCNIRIVFTLMTQTIRNITAGVPKRHLVYDYNHDGSFDRYLHMKAFSISGHYGSKRNAQLVFNGSANWSTLGQISDEQGMIIRRDKVTRQYQRWITGLYNNAPRGYRPLPTAPTRGYDPYAELELELD